MSSLLPVSAQTVGNAFVQQYYHILHHSPEVVYKFYQDISKLGRPEADGSLSITTTMEAINEKIISLNYAEIRAVILYVDAQESLNGGVHVLVTGYLIEKNGTKKNFAQTFFLAPQDKGYFVLNDMFRYLDDVPPQLPEPLAPVNVIMAPLPYEEPKEYVQPPMEKNQFPEQIAPPSEEVHVEEQPQVVENNIPVAEEENFPEVINPPEIENGRVVEEELTPPPPPPSKVENNSDIKPEDLPKKSYASIVMHLKESDATFSPPPRKTVTKPQEQVNQSTPLQNGSVTNPDSIEDGNKQEEETEGYSIYIKDLPMNATHAMLQDEFKKFGVIKVGGIQVRRIRGFCFGFIEFETPSAVEKALEASPIELGGQKVVVEEKRSTNGRGGNRGRFFYAGRGGYRNDGVRGRGGYYNGGRGNGGGGGYGREFGGRAEFVQSRGGGSRGGFGARGDGGYHQRGGADNFSNNGDRAPRVSATA